MTILAGRRVLVVGTLSPLGRVIVDRMASQGARVVGVDHVSGDTQSGLLAHIVADMTIAADAERALSDADAVLGGLDSVVLGAAVQRGGRVWETTDEIWRAVLTGTLDTTFVTLRAALRVLLRGGSIVAISSINAELAHPSNAAYAAAKGAVNTLIRQSALDCAPRGIRVNAVAPALVDGPPEAAAGYPWGATVTAAQVADAVCFLLSDLAGGVTGVILPVDGGLSITSPAAMTRPAFVERLANGAAEFNDGAP